MENGTVNDGELTYVTPTFEEVQGKKEKERILHNFVDSDDDASRI
jgi:hypothetical protein